MKMRKMIQSRVKARRVAAAAAWTAAALCILLVVLLSSSSSSSSTYHNAAVLWTPVVEASKDSYSYYANGITNPNIKEKMYWREGYNVLEDLDQFAALYVTYHSCA
jgi:hypothetical protein